MCTLCGYDGCGTGQINHPIFDWPEVVQCKNCGFSILSLCCGTWRLDGVKEPDVCPLCSDWVVEREIERVECGEYGPCLPVWGDDD